MVYRWMGDKALTEPVDAIVYLVYIDGLAQDCSISIANALEMLQSCTKPSIYAPPNLNE